MIKFKDLKVGDIVSTLDNGTDYEITRIETSENSTLNEGYYHYDCSNLIDWLNKNHFDYRGLIEKGLAIDATNLNILLSYG